MTYKCPKGHESTDSDYCSECGALIGQSTILKSDILKDSDISMQVPVGGQECCPDCGTPRVGGARFCEVCRHDFLENKTGVAEVIVASKKTSIDQKPSKADTKAAISIISGIPSVGPLSNSDSKTSFENMPVIPVKLNIVISVDKEKAVNCGIETSIKPDVTDRVFPLDLDENLVGRRSANRGIYPEMEVNDPGVSHRHLKFIKQPDGNFGVLELQSANGTELNNMPLEPGIITTVKAGDELSIGIWTKLKLINR
ncbi:MAG: FHA domain-containing protein [Bacillota bacterium]|nr:FHA domain-containing protein [Bacillota bacterium]